MKDIWLCFDTFYTLNCNSVWRLLIKCGTFIEIHKPFDPVIISSINLETAAWNKEQAITNMVISNLCSGLYHLWMVYYSRIGQIVKRVEPFYVVYPSCSC